MATHAAPPLIDLPHGRPRLRRAAALLRRDLEDGQAENKRRLRSHGAAAVHPGAVEAPKWRRRKLPKLTRRLPRAARRRRAGKDVVAQPGAEVCAASRSLKRHRRRVREVVGVPDVPIPRLEAPRHTRLHGHRRVHRHGGQVRLKLGPCGVLERAVHCRSSIVQGKAARGRVGRPRVRTPAIEAADDTSEDEGRPYPTSSPPASILRSGP